MFVTGARTDECIRCTLHAAIVRGYDATLIADAHTTRDLQEWDAPSPDKGSTTGSEGWNGYTDSVIFN